MIDPRLLHQLSVIVTLGSMSRAARHLGVTQPTLSRNIRLIEDRVGGPVVRRGRYGVTATVIGERLAERGRLIAEAARHADESIDQWRAGLSGEIRIGVGPMLAATIMPAFFREALSQRTPYAIRAFTTAAAGLLAELDRGAIDIAIAPEQMTLNHERLAQARLMSDSQAVYAGAKSQLGCDGEIVPVDRLRRERWIVTGLLSGIEASSTELLGRLGLADVVPALSFTGDVVITLELLRTTDVVTILPRGLLALAPAMDGVRELRLEVDLPPRNIALWVAKANRDDPAIIHCSRKLAAFFERVQRGATP